MHNPQFYVSGKGKRLIAVFALVTIAITDVITLQSISVTLMNITQHVYCCMIGIDQEDVISNYNHYDGSIIKNLHKLS